MPGVEANGVRINYEDVGSGPPVVLIHGLGSSARDWERQIGPLSGSWRFIAVDLRGHGNSDKPPGPYSLSDFATDVARVIEHLDIGPLPVVGISLGGMTAFQLAADRPELVSRVMSVNALPVFDVDSTGMRVQIALRKLITRFMGMEKIGRVLAPKLFPDEDMTAEREMLIERWAENDKRAYRAAFQAILDWPGVMEEMARFDKPILVVASDQDYTPVEAKRPYVERMPTARMVVIENAHHAVPVERPERFNEVLAGFLA